MLTTILAFTKNRPLTFIQLLFVHVVIASAVPEVLSFKIPKYLDFLPAKLRLK